MNPPFDGKGNLPPGIHQLQWDEILQRYGYNSHRARLLSGLKRALKIFKNAGCKIIYLDGSFVTVKKFPSDYDCCWVPKDVDLNRLDPILLDVTIPGRRKQKFKYDGEFLPSTTIESATWKTFLDFFQTDKNTGDQKGIIEIRLEDLS
jgi:hypothetical protein